MHLFPALLAAAFAFWCGSFAGAASFPAGALGQIALLIAALTVAASWRDPLQLGGAGRWLPWAVVVAVAASLLASPVPRAGRIAWVLLPAWCLIPAFVARCWSSARRSEAGLRALGVAGAAVAGVALFQAWSSTTGVGLGRAAMPLGHHNLLAAFLVTLSPLVALGLRSRGVSRAVSLAALVAMVGAVVASRSLLNCAALAGVAIVAFWRHERAGHFVQGVALLGLAALAPRAAAIVAGQDSSASARSVYSVAAWEGFLERPILGWGPGSTPWTLAEHARPLPGVNPPGEVVGEAHSLPLQLLYELGAPGCALLLALGALFLWRRSRAARIPDDRFDPELARAGVLSVVAGLVSGLGAAWTAVPALPLALALGAGAALAGSRRGTRTTPASSGRQRVPVFVYVAAALFAIVPAARAHREYEIARRSPTRAAAAPHLLRAIELDPAFPLYRARWAWSAPGVSADRRAEEAVRAARDAHGVGALWLRAGGIAIEAGRREMAAVAFERALRLDPLAAFAPFQLAQLGVDPATCAARALLSQPALAGATLFRDAEAARLAAIERAENWPHIDAGWRAAFGRDARVVTLDGTDAADLTLKMDESAALSLSVHAFRRSAWSADLARVPVERQAVRALRNLPSAAAMASSAAGAFARDRCAAE